MTVVVEHQTGQLVETAETRAVAPVDRRPLGAVPHADGRTSFAVWAPRAEQIVLVLDGGRRVPLERRAGYAGALVEGCGPGTRYRYELDGRPLADPASRFQPEGVHGPSEVVDLAAHAWADRSWVAPPLHRYAISELHIGTFTPEGTFDAAAGQLDRLAEVGFTAVEPMPLAQFPGRRNWGYDGVFPFAVQDSYGGPAGFQRFVDACHARGLAVVLDVVYNHLGPEGNVLGAYGPYFTDRYRTPWGDAVNVSEAGSDEVRRYFVENALGWFADFHVDALRLDAVHGIVDPTASPFLAELARATADLSAASGRQLLLIAESADNNPAVVTAQAAGGLGLDAQWNDDFHHALHTALTGERHHYYADFGSPGLLARAMAEGFSYQGEHSGFRGRRHGARSTAIEPERLVIFTQNHDHVGNRPQGQRLSTQVGPDQLRLAAAAVLLAPGVPLLFMGEEYGETAPFAYFVDHGDPDLLEAVRRGRAEEIAASTWDEEAADPADPATFAAAVLDPAAERPGRAQLVALHRRLLALRAEHPALVRSTRQEATAHTEGPVVVLERRHGTQAVAALFNLGPEPAAARLPEPPSGGWRVLADSAEPELGGQGERAPAAAAAGHLVALGAWGFVAYQAGGEG